MILSGWGCRYDQQQAVMLPDTVSFQADILPLLNTQCSLIDCHSGSHPTGNLNLSASSAYTQLFARHEIDTIQPAKSLLYIQMNSLGTPMPPSGRLSDYDVSLVLTWITQGAKDN